MHTNTHKQTHFNAIKDLTESVLYTVKTMHRDTSMENGIQTAHIIQTCVSHLLRHWQTKQINETNSPVKCVLYTNKT